MNRSIRMRLTRRCARSFRAERYRGGAWLPRLVVEAAPGEKAPSRSRRTQRAERWRSMVHLFVCRLPSRRHELWVIRR